MNSTLMSYTFNKFLPYLQLTLHESTQTWLRHTTTAIRLEPGRTRVIMFGGCPNWQWGGKSEYTQHKLAKTAVLEFGEQNTHAQSWICLFNY